MSEQLANTLSHSASAAKDALGDKVDSKSHDAKAEAYKQNV